MLLFQKMREGYNGLSYCVRVKELVRANMSKNVVVCVCVCGGGDLLEGD